MPSRSDRGRLLLRFTTFATALGYFVYGISRREVSLLESQDLGIAADLFDTFAITPDHSPLHFVFLNVWQRLNAHSVAFLRLPSAFACALAAVIVLVIGESEAGVLAGVLSALFFVLDPLVVDNARSLRMYAWILLFCAASLGCAYAYLCRARLRRHLVGFALASALAIYTHLFSWLWVAPLAALLVFDLYRGRADHAAPQGARRIVLVSAVVLVPQVIHGFVALAFTRERHALYGGVSADTHGFLYGVGRTLFLGESWPEFHPHGYLVLLPVALLVGALLVIALRSARARAWAVAAIVLPGFALAWIASSSHEVEARYLNYLAPILALCMGIGIAKTRRPLLWAWAPLAIAVACVSAYATHVSYAGPPTDWYDAAARLETIATPDDVVGVFPGYWAATLQRYSQRKELVRVTFPIDLERLLERGKPVILVRNKGRYFGTLQALLRARTRSRTVFSTGLRDTLDVDRIQAMPPESFRIEHPEQPAIVLAGLIGSGGYPWQRQPDAVHAFDRLRALFASASSVVTGYEAYDPAWYQALRWGSDGLRDMHPNAQVDAALRAAGISDVALIRAGAENTRAAALLASLGVRVLPVLSATQASAPRVIDVGGIAVGMLQLSREASGSVAGLARRVQEAKRMLPAGGRLVVVVVGHGDYARTASAVERAAARALIDAGADVVAGEGAYAAREVEVYKAGIIAYSLGTLLRPREQSLNASDSSGIALRLRFSPEGMLSYQVFATTFDDQSRPAPGRTVDIQYLLLRTQDQTRAWLSDALASAQAAWADAEGEWHTLGAFERGRDLLPNPMPPWIEARLEASLQWFPLAPGWSRLRPFDGGFARDGAYAGIRGVLALGKYRRAIELDGGGHARVRLRFRKRLLRAPLWVTLGLPDDRIVSKYIPFDPQRMILRIDGREVLRDDVAYRAGWNARSIDARSVPDAPCELEIELQSEGTHFPVALDVVASEASTGGR